MLFSFYTWKHWRRVTTTEWQFSIYARNKSHHIRHWKTSKKPWSNKSHWTTPNTSTDIKTICSRIYTTPNHHFQYIQGQKLTGAQSPMALRFWSGLQCVSMTSITKGEVPTDWGQANVIPIFKKGEKYLASNYRPVSLTCIGFKLLEHCSE